MLNSIHISAFSTTKRVNHGGVRRSVQLSSLAVEQGRQITYPLENKVALRRAFFKPILVLKALSLLSKIGPSRFTLKGLIVTISQCVWLLDLLKKNTSDNEIGIEIAPGRPMILAALLGVLGKKFVAYPHNVEFLVPGQVQGIFSGPEQDYFIERFVYQSAKKVITISRFDAAVIKSMGVAKVAVLPYIPVSEFRDELLKIKEKRATTEKKGVLILGTVGNIPTREGVQNMLDMIAQNSLGIQFKLAGYGTEIFIDSSPASLEVLGSVTKEVMFDLMSGCKCLLINQPQTSGMLTRIVEAEFVDIPVYVLSDYMQADDPSLRMTKRITSLSALAELIGDDDKKF